MSPIFLLNFECIDYSYSNYFDILAYWLQICLSSSSVLFGGRSSCVLASLQPGNIWLDTELVTYLVGWWIFFILINFLEFSFLGCIKLLENSLILSVLLSMIYLAYLSSLGVISPHYWARPFWAKVQMFGIKRSLLSGRLVGWATSEGTADTLVEFSREEEGGLFYACLPNFPWALGE